MPCLALPSAQGQFDVFFYSLRALLLDIDVGDNVPTHLSSYLCMCGSKIAFIGDNVSLAIAS